MDSFFTPDSRSRLVSYLRSLGCWSCYICTDTKLRPTLNTQNTLTQWQKPEKFTANTLNSKALIVIALLCLFNCNLFSQNGSQCDYYADGATWYYQRVDGSFGSSKEYDYTTMEILKDTVISGDSAKVISHNSSCSMIHTRVIRLQNDSLFYFDDDSTEFRLLYDFTATEGEDRDIVTNRLPPYHDSIHIDTFTIKVDSVSSTFINGEELTVQHVSHNSHITFGIDEKITKYFGAASGFFPVENGLCKPAPSAVRCYINNHCDIEYNSGIEETCDTTYTKTINSNNQEDKYTEGIQVFPNPATEQIRVSRPAQSQPADYRLISINGKEVKNGRLNSPEENIKVSDLTSVVYLLIFESKSEQFTKKIMIK